MRRLVPFLLLALLACGEAQPPAPAPGPAVVPAPEPDAGPGPFTLETRPGVPGRPPPVLLVGDVEGVTVKVARLVDPEPPLGWDGPGELVCERPARADHWSFLPALPTGIYRVTARRGEERQERMLVVSDLAVIVKRAAREALVWVVDAEDGTPVASAKVVHRHGGGNREGVTDRSGVCRFEVPSDERLEILVRRNGRIGYAEDDGFPTKDVVAFLMLDRYEYEPGDEIRVAGVYRQRNGDVRRVEAPEVRILVRDERGSVVAEAAPEAHEPGFFHGRVRLPLEPPSGPLDLVASLGRGEEAVRIPVPDRPDVGFSIGMFMIPAGGMNPGAGDAFSLSARDVVGRPLAGARVLYRVERKDRGRFFPILSGRGLLDPDGTFGWTVERTAPGLHRVRAEVIDRNGLRATSEMEFGAAGPVAGSGSDLGIEVEPAVAAPGAEVVVRIPVSAALQDRPVLLTMTGRGLGPHAVEKAAGPRHETIFRVPDHPGEILRFEVTTVDGRRVRRGVAEVVVDAGHRKLDVDVEPDGATLVVTVKGEIPESARGLVAVFPSPVIVTRTEIERVFYEGTEERILRIGGVEDLGPGAPEPAKPGWSADRTPVLWRTDVRFEDGKAVVPLDLPEDGRRYAIDVAVATPDHRFGSALRFLDRPGEPAPAAEAPARPATRLRSRSRPGSLPAGLSSCSLDLPADATDARLEILVTRGTLAAAARAARAEMGRSLETADGAIASFLPALLVWQRAREYSEGLGIDRAKVMAAARAALARLFALQREDGGFAPWDGALSDTATTARVLEALLEVRPWVDVDKTRIRRAVDRLRPVASSDDATAAHIFDVVSRVRARDVDGIGKRFPPGSWKRLPPRARARLITILPFADEPTIKRYFAAFLREARRGPGEALSWSDVPGRDVETTAIVLGNLPIEDVDGAARFLLDRRTGPSWADPRTATEAVRALMSRGTGIAPEAGDPVPLRIRVESGLVAAVKLSREELTTTGRVFVVADGSVPRGPFEVEFTRGGDADVDVVAVLTWRGAADGPEPDDRVALRSTLSRIATDGRTSLSGAVERGETLLMTVEVEAKTSVGSLAVDMPFATGTIALPAHVFDIGTPPGVGRTDRDDRVRFLLPAMERGGRAKLELVLRATWEGKFVIRAATATGLDSGAHLGAGEAGTLEVR